MKKILFILIFFVNISVLASGGTLKRNSVIECNGEYYGNHGNPLHWHKTKMVNGNWVSDGGVVEIPSCYIKPVNSYEEVLFSKCIDGDTAKFIVNDKERIVRFLAINTPEVASNLKEEEPYGKEASDYTCNVLKNSKKIILEYDANSDREDKYGRILAFVHVDDELLESKLISKGYAKLDYIYGDYNHLDELRELEEKTKNAKIGMWQDENPLPDEKNISDNEEMSGLEEIFYAILRFFYAIFTKIFA